jgi:serine protease Do
MPDKPKSNLLGRSFMTCIVVLLAITFGFSAGLGGAFVGFRLFGTNSDIVGLPQPKTIVDEDTDVTAVVEKTTDAVVSVIVTRDLPRLESLDDGFFSPRYRQNGTEPRQVGAGTGFLISADGYIITNKHVVDDTKATYSVLLNSGETKDAKVLARDTILDIAVLKIEGSNYSHLALGDSSNLKLGQRVIAIGNALGRFQNTVSVGIVSGLSRSIVASDGRGASEQLENIIQTDASINPGNSGGPLLDYAGNVIGVNVAVAVDAENIGFAIPVSEIKKVVDSVLAYGEIRRPYIGVRYVAVNKTIAEQRSLAVDYGALVIKGDAGSDSAVVPGSPAEKAGLKEDDIIISVNDEKLTNSLQTVVQKYNIGDKLKLGIMRDGKEITVEVTLEQQK